MYDIEGMFHQVYVNPEHHNFLQFLWWKNGTINRHGVQNDGSPFRCYLLTRLCKFHAKEGCKWFWRPVWGQSSWLCEELFNVDDGLRPVSTPQAATSLVETTKMFCGKGGFNLHKFVSNHKAVVDSILQDDWEFYRIWTLPKTCYQLNMLSWCAESDSLQFRVELKDQPLWRSGILSTVRCVFDLLRLLTPLILIWKKILQELCCDRAGWDGIVSEPLLARWEWWGGDLLQLSNLKVPRCYKTEGFGEVKSVELHHFSDASKDAYGQCSYLWLVNHSGQIHCNG